MPKLLPGHIEVAAFLPEALSDWANPTATEMNAALANSMGWLISCAIDADGYELGATGFAEDDSRSICDIGNVVAASYVEYSGSLDGFRSDPDDPTPVYDTFFELFATVGKTYYLVERVGPEQGTAFAAGQVVSAYGFETDFPVDVTGDNEPIRLGARLLPNGNINTYVDLGA